MDADLQKNAKAAEWLSVVGRLGSQFKLAQPEQRVRLYLEAMRDEFHWAIAEYWVRSHDGYRITHEAHADQEALHRFARQSVSVVVPPGWVRPERWRTDPGVPESAARQVFWSESDTLSKVTIRGGMIREAGLRTQVAIPVPDGGELRQIVMLFDTESRKPSPEEADALAIASLLLGWANESAPTGNDQSLHAPDSPTRLDEQTRRLVGPLGSVRLTPLEWDSLTLLLANTGTALSFAKLSSDVWLAPAEFVERPVIYDLIRRLRRQLLSVGGGYRIVSVPGFGYMLESTAR